MNAYTAATSTQCEFNGGCASGKPAVHRFQYRDLCPFHSPFDVVTETPRKALHTTAPVAPVVYRSPKARRHAAQMYAMQVRMDARPVIVPTPEMETAYLQYISDGIGDTDGYYAPIDRQAFFRLYY